MIREKHIKAHVQLHKALDELVVDMIEQTNMLPSKTTVRELMEWSNVQTENPTE